MSGVPTVGGTATGSGSVVAVEYGRFQRAIQRGQLFQAELAARELGYLNLADALSLATLIGQDGPARYGRAAVRWHGRFALEATDLSWRIRSSPSPHSPLCQPIWRVQELCSAAWDDATGCQAFDEPDEQPRRTTRDGRSRSLSARLRRFSASHATVVPLPPKPAERQR